MTGNAPAMQLGDDEPSRLPALTPNRFVAPNMGAHALSRLLEFHRDASGAVYGLTVDVGGARYYYHKDTQQGGKR